MSLLTRLSYLLFISVFLVSVLYLIISYSYTLMSSIYSYNRFWAQTDGYANRTDEKLILLAWTTLWDRPFPLYNFGVCSNQELMNKCLMTNDRGLLLQSSVVIFHVRDIDYKDIPPTKPAQSKFVFYNSESPVLTYTPLKGLPSGYFDWTMTYRLDSDIYCPYGYIEPNKNSDTSWKRYLNNKTKLVAWFVSHCQTDSYRERYVYELQKFIPVDIYGRCGSLKCPDSMHTDCNDLLRKTYKFYLSLENAVCKDYVTEKFFSRLRDSVIPIVARRSDYDLIAPNHSFIALDDFHSPRELSKYLLYLDENDDKYLQYFQWRTHYHAVAYNLKKFCLCGLCETLVQEKEQRLKKLKRPETKQQQQSKLLNIHEWWYVNGACGHKYIDKLLRFKRNISINY